VLSKKLVSRTNRLLRKFGVEMRRYSPPANASFSNWMYYSKVLERAWLKTEHGAPALDEGFVDFCVRHHEHSRSQIFQDLLVLFLLQEKRGGFFVEFGATDGVSLSNTWLLEKHYGWSGIVAEPARRWHKALIKNRGCTIDTRCVWSQSGETLVFNETEEAELSTLENFVGSDHKSKDRVVAHPYRVETVSLIDLLVGNDAPHAIDYISIDTEGSEYSILKDFDFDAFEIGIITVEHNFVKSNREKLFQLLAKNGFRNVLAEHSTFDDWYVNENVLRNRLAGLSAGTPSQSRTDGMPAHP
jgi:FkbM family methyltransferase